MRTYVIAQGHLMNAFMTSTGRKSKKEGRYIYISVLVIYIVYIYIYVCVYVYIYIYIVIREGNGTPLQYPFLENPMDGGAWWAAVHEVAKSWTRVSDFPFTSHFHALEKEVQPTPVFLPGESQGRGSLMGCRLWSHRVGHD